jgi:hypothetical protein
MSEENFSPEDSLALIQGMIDKTKENISEKSIFFLIWGWLTFIACLGQFILKHIVNYEKHYQVWWLMMVGFVLSIYYGAKQGKKRRVKTYVQEGMDYLWTGMAITFFILAVILSSMGWGNTVFPFYTMLYGLGTFVSGSFLKFKPMIVGGIIAWVLAIAGTFLSYDYQILAGAAAILFSYIIPGHLLNALRKENEHNTITNV